MSDDAWASVLYVLACFGVLSGLLLAARLWRVLIPAALGLGFLAIVPIEVTAALIATGVVLGALAGVLHLVTATQTRAAVAVALLVCALGAAFVR